MENSTVAALFHSSLAFVAYGWFRLAARGGKVILPVGRNRHLLLASNAVVIIQTHVPIARHAQTILPVDLRRAGVIAVQTRAATQHNICFISAPAESL